MTNSPDAQGTFERIDLLDARQFQIVVRRLADSLNYGTDRSPFLGSGIEYAQSRLYQAGDSVRDIDWRISARTGRFFVKEYETPKCMPLYLIVDTSASMTVSSVAGNSKYKTALHLAGGLALAALERVSPVGVVGVGERNLKLTPSLSKAQIMQWMLALRHFRFDEGTTLGLRLAELIPSLKSRALVIVLSDLHDPMATKALKRLAQVHDCAVIQLQDPAERELRGAGLVRAREAETGHEFATHGRRRHLDQERLEAKLRRNGIDHLRLDIARPYLAAVRRFVSSRGLLGKVAR
ncbi:MAG: DUF58 domain-containing protein [Planctomycetota bacterium]|jgi:uncharacterized protein (DUF58 family)|nr:DUF58 domain-containing protein [Planctomycetota bacterium]MDP6370214.1 DUF58 domain-containing protein [Planctomycetota bacterium]MDP6839307.1 DUF58 domain-containing protein [Planctomycetota bacterium]MDP6955134.1 DUF58 domain-containing protein [Planctomycetota bacterium]